MKSLQGKQLNIKVTQQENSYIISLSETEVDYNHLSPTASRETSNLQ
jgi:hypothetical protein